MKKVQFGKLIWICAVMMPLVLLSSCERKWKQPTDVSFKFDINKKSGSMPFLTFEGGHIHIENFKFEGDRVQGDDVVFEDDFDGGSTVFISASVVDVPLEYDIPQGTYSDIDITLTIDQGPVNNRSIQLLGTFHSDYEDFQVVFELKSNLEIKIQARNKSGGYEVDLVKDQPTVATIKIDPTYWFGLITEEQLLNVKPLVSDGERIIVISEKSNKELYQLIVGRITQTYEVSFD